MKKLLLLFATLLIFNKNNAQIVFCPGGAEWHYTLRNGFNPEAQNIKIKYTHDSIVGTNSFKVLSHYIFFTWTNSGGDGPTLIKQNGDTVFMRNARTQHAWQILYNFNASIGQSWQNNIVTDTQLNVPTSTVIVTYTTTVDSIGTVVVNGFNLKRLYVSYKNNQVSHNYSGKAIITERFGYNGFLFNFINVSTSDWAFIGDFLCYQDSTFGLKQFTSMPCDFANLSGIMDFRITTSGLKLFPNPTLSILNLKLENQNGADNYKVRLTNILGKEILSQQRIKSEDENFVLDLSTLEKGIYSVEVFEKGKLIATEKIVKE